MDKSNSVDIAIISYNNFNFTKDCIDSILKNTKDIDYRIIIIDNGSTEETLRNIKNTFPDILLIENGNNIGYAAAINRASELSNSPYMIISNNDVIVLENTISKLIDYLEKNLDVGIAGVQQLYPNGKIQYSSGSFPSIKLSIKNLLFISNIIDISTNKKYSKGIDLSPRIVEYIDGAFFAINRKIFDEIGGFDSSFFFFSEEADYCYRLKQNNWKAVLLPFINIIHYRGAGIGDNKGGLDYKRIKLMVSSKVKFLRKHHNIIYTFTCILLEIIGHLLKLTIFILPSIFYKKFKNKLMLNIYFIKSWAICLKK